MWSVARESCHFYSVNLCLSSKFWTPDAVPKDPNISHGLIAQSYLPSSAWRFSLLGNISACIEPSGWCVGEFNDNLAAGIGFFFAFSFRRLRQCVCLDFIVSWYCVILLVASRISTGILLNERHCIDTETFFLIYQRHSHLASNHPTSGFLGRAFDKVRNIIFTWRSLTPSLLIDSWGRFIAITAAFHLTLFHSLRAHLPPMWPSHSQGKGDGAIMKISVCALALPYMELPSE